MPKQVTPTYWLYRKQLKQLLNQPLPDGRGFQHAQDKHLHYLCEQISSFELPKR